MIKQILNENNTELRTLLEEGSGITKYKARRKETQRKLDRTQSDLTAALRHHRGDRPRGALPAAAGGQGPAPPAAVQGDPRPGPGCWPPAGTRDLDRQETEAREKLEEFRTQAEAGVGELAELQARIEAARPQLDEREAERRQLEEALQAFEEELQETERQVLVLEHRIDEHQRRIDDNTESASGRPSAARRRSRARSSAWASTWQTIDDELETSRPAAGREGRGPADPRRPPGGATARPWTTPPAATWRSSRTTPPRRSHLRELQVKQENRRERMGILAEDREAALAPGRRRPRPAWPSWARPVPRPWPAAARLLEELAGMRARRDRPGDHAPPACRSRAAALQARREAARSTCDLLQQAAGGLRGLRPGAARNPQAPRRRSPGHRRPGRPAAGGRRGRGRPGDPAGRDLLDAVVVDGPGTAAGPGARAAGRGHRARPASCAATASAAGGRRPGRLPAADVLPARSSPGPAPRSRPCATCWPGP